MATAIDAKGDLIVGTGADTFARLEAGTNGFTLVADSSVSPTGLKWAVDPVADVVTTAGDLLYATAADTVTRLGIGTAGQVLKVNSGATAPEWGAASAAGDNFTLLNSGGTALTGAATVTVSGISGKNQLMIRFINASSANANALIQLRLNGDSGSEYFYSTFFFNRNSTSANFILDVTGSNSTTQIVALGGLSASASSAMNGGVNIFGTNSSGVKILSGYGASDAAGGSENNRAYFTFGGYNGSSAISSVSLVSSSGDFDGGTMFVFGA
jgi:Tfp pilus assembly protein PilV